MKVFACPLLVFFLSFHAIPATTQDMNNNQLGKLLSTVSDTIRNEGNIWELIIQDMIMICITDEVNNRMRIISPIVEMKEVSVEQVNDAMEANFHSALDVRYCISDQIMWAAFIHPLSELSDNQVLDAVHQVYSAVSTFGTDYASTTLAFPRSEKQDTIPGKKF